jgi:hypothetical protein
MPCNSAGVRGLPLTVVLAGPKGLREGAEEEEDIITINLEQLQITEFFSRITTN